ncbi:ribosomal L24-like protein involved in ribosome biogenesis Rlp24 [Schizosaccharomyces osmophilus]|uniref:Ribosome biogenesis protein RLP24 n=1 Tax=Schizosaccharomyces osmophilus TaxID=2545709 RepID=A0AAF0AWJ9_9SCHI|nr:ribosomal L24-like protein involved in ribosome biogenesis Rlp24 [Schizosaccharomyces osmophilus]WBW73757.1 ribosomal L24-like protein involved in ribosome biogenesis Rlp24 [Schizosaccharomyces osmophilus]
MRVFTCYFCSGPVYPGHGMMFVRNDSKVFRFCRSKCHKNFKMKRNPRKVAWTKSYRKAHGKEMVYDKALAVSAARRNVPVRYDRNVVATTLTAMKRSAHIHAKRERMFVKKRLSGKKSQQLSEAQKLVGQNVPQFAEKETVEEKEPSEPQEAQVVSDEEYAMDEEPAEAVKVPVAATKKRKNKKSRGEGAMDMD